MVEPAVTQQEGQRMGEVRRLYTASPPGGLTGGPVCALEHLLALKASFHEVCLILCEGGALADRAGEAGIPVWLSPFEYRGLRHGGWTQRVKGIGPVVRSRWAYVSGLARMLKKRPGILHIHSRAAHLPYALLAGWLAGVPVAVSVHEPRSAGTETWLDLWMIRLFARHVVFPAKAISREYPEHLRRKSTISGYYAEVAPSDRPSAAEVSPRILFPARLSHRKGVDLFLEVCGRLRRMGVPFQAWMGGGGWHSEDDRRQATEYIAANGLETTVEDLGILPGLSPVYARADILLLPSRRDPLPRVVMEAMCYGIPVVATRVDGIPEMVEDGVTGYLVESGDVQGFTTAVQRLLEDQALRLRLGTAGRARAKEMFSRAAYCRRMLDVYREMGKRP
jgi:glycosyltransferase involved in cell wall biosynthesis